MSNFKSQSGFSILLLLGALTLILFLLITSTAPFRNHLMSALFPKDSSFAASPYNPGDADGDLDVDVFDYNTLLTNFGKIFNNADFDGNGKVDIFELLTDFGKQGPNIASDLDKNGRVDIFDFNILLTNFGK